jgi:nucleoside-triphosphatase THEP1
MADNHVYIITGKQGEGKTTLLREVVDRLQHAGVKTGGFIAEGTWKDGQRAGFSLVRISDGESFPLSTTSPKEGYFKLKRFWFNPETVRVGNEALLACLNDETQVVVIDEIGIFELEEKIWYRPFINLLAETDKPLIITVRDKIKEEVLKKFGLNTYTFFSTGESPSYLAGIIIRSVKY